MSHLIIPCHCWYWGGFSYNLGQNLLRHIEDKIRVPFSTDLNAHNFYCNPPPLPQFNVDIIRQPHVRSIGIISTTLNWGVWGGGANRIIQILRI